MYTMVFTYNGVGVTLSAIVVQIKKSVFYLVCLYCGRINLLMFYNVMNLIIMIWIGVKSSINNQEGYGVYKLAAVFFNGISSV